MTIVIAIDPGISKCGLIIADLKEKKVYEALVIKSNLLLNYVKKIYQKGKKHQFLIGNGTSSENYIKDLNHLSDNLIIVEEKNSTFRAKQRYFEIFPLKGIQCLFPREIFILNKNDKVNFELEAVSLTNSKTAQPVIVELNINYSKS